MPCRLLVILGAGASFDCASDRGGILHEEWRPPLVTQLFENRASFTQILHAYPLAEQAAADIRPAISKGAVAIEAFLRDRLRDSVFEHDRRQYWAIPLYLQHLLFEVSMWDYASRRGYAAHPDSYDRLINAALRVDEVTFVTLNYDDLFDRRLFIHGQLTSMESYLGPGKSWALIKLHGSINWVRIVVNAPPHPAPTDPVLAQTFAALGDQIQLDDTIVLRPQVDLRDVRMDDGAVRRLYYPALSAPLGVEDELVCPPAHVQYLREFTGHYDPLDVLVIGYSGLDQEVLKLLGWGERPIRSLWVVSGTDEGAHETAERITRHVRILPSPRDDTVALIGDGFTHFAQSAVLDAYIERIRDLAREEDERRATNPSFVG